MALKTLETLVGKTSFETLPPNWNEFDLATFSRGKRLWDYQQTSLKQAAVALFKHYEDFLNFEPGEDESADQERKARTCDWYEQGCPLTPQERKALNLNLKKARLPTRELLEDYYEFEEDAPVIDFQDVCNRMSFWMATGSGKTLVLVKLLEVLHLLMRREEIPERDVLFLTCREDLIDQFIATVDEFNQCPDAPVYIELKELRDYPEAKREAPGASRSGFHPAGFLLPLG